MFLAAALANERLKKDKAAPHLLLVVSHIEEAENDFEDLNTFLPRHTSLFPAIEDMYGADFADNADIQTQRIQVLNQILHHDVYTGNRSDIIVAPILGLLQAVPSRKTISEHILKIQRNHEHPQEELIAWLQDHHYQVSTQVENAGEYALRGGIIDVFPFASDTPYRIEYFGDEVESIRRFHVESQLSEQDLDACQILALDKMYTANALPEESRQTSLLTYLSKDTWVVLVEPAHIEDRARKVLASIDAEDGATDLRKERTDKRVCPYHPFDEVFSQLRSFRKITVSKLPVSSNDGDYTFHVKSADIFPQKIQR
jgi:Transcription-repair coupling factor (superfamily II helicase)